MSLLSKTTKGKIKKPHLALVFGVDGIGKTTFGASAPSPIIIGPESGSNNLDVARIEPRNYAEIMGIIEELRIHNHDYKTAVFDSLDWIEPMVWQAVCESGKVASIELFGGGYGKGYVEANSYWGKMIAGIRKLRDEKDMNIILIAHSQIKAFNDPSQPAPYDRYMLKLNEKAGALWREFVDFVGFATYETFTKKEAGDKKSKAYGDGKRVLYTERRPSFDAKNRMGLPFELEFSYEAFDNAASNPVELSASSLRESILDMVKEVSDGELKSKVLETVEKARDDLKQLEAIKNRLAIRLGAN